jgi:mRNA-degrading endonuclease RelE of RelBE toxin-antitoxin system
LSEEASKNEFSQEIQEILDRLQEKYREKLNKKFEEIMKEVDTMLKETSPTEHPVKEEGHT